MEVKIKSATFESLERTSIKPINKMATFKITEEGNNSLETIENNSPLRYKGTAHTFNFGMKDRKSYNVFQNMENGKTYVSVRVQGDKITAKPKDFSNLSRCHTEFMF